MKKLIPKCQEGWLTPQGKEIISKAPTEEYRVSGKAESHSKKGRKSLLIGVISPVDGKAIVGPEDLTQDELELWDVLRRDKTSPYLAQGLSRGLSTDDAAAEYIRNQRQGALKQYQTDVAFNLYEHKDDLPDDGQH